MARENLQPAANQELRVMLAAGRRLKVLLPLPSNDDLTAEIDALLRKLRMIEASKIEEVDGQKQNGADQERDDKDIKR